jgi:deazaflavin-dependent oxidoreductase (nitroreductase family)
VPLPRALGRFNRRVTNRLLGPVVTLLPWFAWLEHVGRRTGRRYRTPVMLFGAGDRRVIAMTYGPDTDWARNVAAAGRATAIGRRGRRVELVAPRIVRDPTRRLVPLPIRPVLMLIGADDFLACGVVAGQQRAPGEGPGAREKRREW